MMSETTRPDNLSIQQAPLEDLGNILGLMDRANEYWFARTGERQWVDMTVTRGQLKSQLEQGCCYLTKDTEGNINSVVTITEDDAYMWGIDGTDGTALYFHKLMKDPVTGPANTGLKLISFVADETLRRGKKYIRCDAKSTLTSLVNYYHKLGLTEKRPAIYPSTGNPAFLLEADPVEVLKRIGELS